MLSRIVLLYVTWNTYRDMLCNRPSTILIAVAEAHVRWNFHGSCNALVRLQLITRAAGLTLFLNFGRHQVLCMTILNVEGLVETLNLLRGCSFVSCVTESTCL